MSSSIENATIQPEGVNTELLCTIFSWLGTAFALFLNLTPAVLFINVFKNNKSHKTIPELMLIFNVLCGLFWFCYWFRMDNPVPCYSALGNTVISLIFSFLYLYLAVGKGLMKCFFACFITADICAQIFYVFGSWIQNIDMVGKIAMIINIMQYAAPGQSIISVIKTGNYNLIPITTTIVGVFCSSSWLGFGVIQNNFNAILPNSMGLILSLIQIIIYYYFKCTEKPANKNEEELVKVETKETPEIN